MNSPQNFFTQNPVKILRSAQTRCASGRGSDAPCGEGSQTGDGEYRREQKGRSPQNVKTAAPETQQMMGAENIRYRRNYERIFFNTTYQPTGDQQERRNRTNRIMQNRAVQANLAYQSCRDSGALFKVLHQSIMSCMTY